MYFPALKYMLFIPYKEHSSSTTRINHIKPTAQYMMSSMGRIKGITGGIRNKGVGFLDRDKCGLMKGIEYENIRHDIYLNERFKEMKE